ncbi:FHA domain-containing protein FhaB/FipA [Ruania halotolerans]|uniref:FHA domain-containing protein FhaB/FipA n=1 Tax=Ruania halotolerans TaxID=2897773 RepID=UPI001E336B54|nr:FHA domain-containing protein [Ruania halotolerans]UFU06643.1 FHA domain-containing protein [Ruania halotolerans]
MSELIVTLLRVGYLALLWLLVLSAIGVLRRDVFGTRVLARGSVLSKPESRTPGPPAPPAGQAQQRGKGTPSRLRVTAGPLNGTTLQLSSTAVLIGRAPGCTLILDDDYCSGRHARIFPGEGQWWVEDLGSRNGTYLGSTRVGEAVPVGVGTPIRIGQTVIELQR